MTSPNLSPSEGERADQELKSIIWHENGKRLERYVRIVEVGGGTLARHWIRQCQSDGFIIGHNTTQAAASAFGKRYKEVGRVG